MSTPINSLFTESPKNDCMEPLNNSFYDNRHFTSHNTLPNDDIVPCDQCGDCIDISEAIDCEVYHDVRYCSTGCQDRYITSD